MRDTDWYGRILGIESPWEVSGVELRLEAGEVEVFVVRGGSESFGCPECRDAALRHDARRRSWRHLPTCQYRRILAADVPRVRCAVHGVRTIGVPWSDRGSGFTALFEALIIDWLGAASISGVAQHLALSWDQVDGVMGRAVKRGLERRGAASGGRLPWVDETSFQKRHDYVTVVADLEGASRVHHVEDGRGLLGGFGVRGRRRLDRHGGMHLHGGALMLDPIEGRRLSLPASVGVWHVPDRPWQPEEADKGRF